MPQAQESTNVRRLAFIVAVILTLAAIAIAAVLLMHWVNHPLPDTSTPTPVHTDPASLLLPTDHRPTPAEPHSIDEWLHQIAGTN